MPFFHLFYISSYVTLFHFSNSYKYYYTESKSKLKAKKIAPMMELELMPFYSDLLEPKSYFKDPNTN